MNKLHRCLDKELSVGQVAQRAGVAVSALHFYETKGLIHSWRNSGNQRRYCLLYTSPSPRDRTRSRMPSSA